MLILNANPAAEALHPDAIYRLNIDNDGDCLTDIAFSYVFSPPARRAADRRRLPGDQAPRPARPKPSAQDLLRRRRLLRRRARRSRRRAAYTFFAGARSDAFFFDYDGIKNLFDTPAAGTSPRRTSVATSPWTGVDSNTESQRVLDRAGAAHERARRRPEIRIWGRCSVRRRRPLLHVDRAGHPSVSSFFNTDDTKEEYNASEPVNDRERWTDMFVHLMGHTGDYTGDEAIAAIDDRAPAARHAELRPFPAGAVPQRSRVHRRRHRPPARLPLEGRHPSRPASAPHTDVLTEFPYLGTPHPTTS